MEADTEDLMDTPDTETTCTICYAEFLDPEDLQQHIGLVHTTRNVKQHPCQFCTAVFTNIESHVLHLRDDHIASMICCKYCTRVFTNKNSCRKHEKKHVSFKRDWYRCSQCSIESDNIHELEQHEITEHYHEADGGVFLNEYYSLLSSLLNVKSSPFLQSLTTNAKAKCQRCGYSSTDAQSYINHLKLSNCKSYTCDTCSVVTRTKKGLWRHFMNHKECHHYVRDEDKVEECRKCLNFVDARLLKQHMQYCKPVKCNMCDVMFKMVEELSDHQTKAHPLAISVINCQICKREFVGRVALEKHVTRVHLPDIDLYKYKCVHCTSTYFKHPKDLFAHFFSRHSKLQPYSCKICDKTFRVRKRFTIHIKIDHSSAGFVEFDNKYHVFFTDKKSEKPFQPSSLSHEFEFLNNLVTRTNKNKSKVLEQSDKSEHKSDNETTDLDRTDAEINDSGTPKMRFKRQAKSDMKLLNSDFMSATEAEAKQTEIEKSTPKVQKLKRKPKVKDGIESKRRKAEEQSIMDVEMLDPDSDDDEPLLIVKKKYQSMKHKAAKHFKRPTIYSSSKSRMSKICKDNKSRLTCNICQKYCYTINNYHHHISMHFKNETKTCVKCSKTFTYKSDLKKHMDTEHGSSKLTETLRSLLEKRKSGGNDTDKELTSSEKFQRTIKRVKTSVNTPATITEVDGKLSVQKFIENFTPEASDSNKNGNSNLKIESVVSLKAVTMSVTKDPVIKMTKCIPKPITYNGKLAMPVRFKQSSNVYQRATIRLVPVPATTKAPATASAPVITSSYSTGDTYDNYQEESFVDHDNMEGDNEEPVPEVGQEVMLANGDQKQVTSIPHVLVLPKLPKNLGDVRIAHLQSEAPYFKIVKVGQAFNDVKNEIVKKEKDDSDKDSGYTVTLPSGTKLVNVNPLAHLLGDTPVEDLVAAKSKYYKPKISNNYENAVAKALMKLNKDKEKANKKKPGKKTDVPVEQ